MTFASPCRVLNVNDDDARRYVLTRLLQSAGFVVSEAATGAEALRLTETDHPDLVLLDVKLPDITGLEVCRQIKADAGLTPIRVVLLSAACVELGDRIAGLESGADAYLIDPLDEGLLVSTIRSQCRSVEAERARARAARHPGPREPGAREAAEELRLLADAAPSLLVELDPAGRHVLVNEAYARRCRRSREALIGMHVREVFGESVYAAIVPHLRAALSGEEVMWEHACPDAPSYYEVRVAPTRWPDGSVRSLVAVAVDVSRRVEAERRERAARASSEAALVALRGSQLGLERLIESDLIGILLANDDRIVYANDAFLSMVGYSREDVDAGLLSWRKMTPPEHAAVDRRALDQLAERGVCTPFEKEYWRKDGSRIPILIGGAALTRQPLESVCFVLDISPQKTARESVEAARRDAEAANRAKDTFLAVLSHELRTSLSVMQNAVHLLKHQLSAEQTGRTIDTLERNVKLQAGVIGDLLDVSRIITGKFRMERCPVALTEVTAEVVEELRPQAEARLLDLDVRLDGRVPVVGDRGRLQQVVSNLLTNAIKFTPEKGRITVSVTPRGDQAHLVVADTGIGISKEFLPRVFEPFQEGPGTAPSARRGLGLGLAIVRNIVEAHGGTVRADSAGENTGTTFTVTLPLLPGPGNGSAAA